MWAEQVRPGGGVTSNWPECPFARLHWRQSLSWGQRWEGGLWPLATGTLCDAPGRERRICLRVSIEAEFLGPPPLPAPKAWLEHKGPLCGA